MKRQPGKPTKGLLTALCTLLLAAMVVGCGDIGGDQAPPTSGDPAADRRASQRVGGEQEGAGNGGTLYERIGGKKMITAIVDDMTERVIADPRVNFARKNVETAWFGKDYEPWEATPDNIERFRQQMINFLALASGGPVKYLGGDMRTVHENMQITNNEFDAMVGDIKASMDRLGVGAREQRDLLAIVETTREQIVEEP